MTSELRHYSAIVEDHVARPRNPGALPDGRRGAAEDEACGDRLVLHVRVERDRVAAASFQAQGCAPVLAVGSLLTELVVGRTPAELAALDAAALERALGGLPRAKHHAARLGALALRRALGAEPSAVAGTPRAP